MALELEDRWVWDFWIAADRGTYHLFFLQAPRYLGNPDLRHRNATVGHATSQDLLDWTEVGTVLEAGLRGEWDDVATWTGSVIQHAGRWWMFYSGASYEEDGLVQRIGAAVSDDLDLWIKHPSNPLINAHPYWYEQLDLDLWFDQAWRDPWVYAIEDGFEMWLTARSNTGPALDRGVIGRAFSSDLSVWTAVPPLTEPGGFGQMEVPQRVALDSGEVLLFSCEWDRLAPSRANLDQRVSDCYLLRLDGEGVPYPASEAVALNVPDLYSVRAVKDPSGQWVVLGFEKLDEQGEFAGRISDPIPLESVVPGPTSKQ